jgi:hypothetical protein
LEAVRKELGVAVEELASARAAAGAAEERARKNDKAYKEEKALKKVRPPTLHMHLGSWWAGVCVSLCVYVCGHTCAADLD